MKREFKPGDVVRVVANGYVPHIGVVVAVTPDNVGVMLPATHTVFAYESDKLQLLPPLTDLDKALLDIPSDDAIP